MEPMNQDLAAKLLVFGAAHGFNHKGTKFMVVIRSPANALGSCDLTLGGSELENLKSLSIRNVWDSFAWSCAKGSHESGCRAPTGRLFDCTRGLKTCFNAYALPSLKYCFPVPCADLIWVWWIVFFAARKDCVRLSFFVWDTQIRLVACVCFIRFITEWTTLWISIWILLLQLVLLELQLL